MRFRPTQTGIRSTRVWLLFAALPALLTNQPFPKGMTVFFVVWVLMLPFAVFWSTLFSR